MGNCAAPQITRNGDHHNWPSSSPPSTLKLVHVDGGLQEFTRTVKASHLLSQYPNCFLCSSESMFIDSIVPRIHDEEDLCLGQLYFLLPLSMFRVPLSFQELCMLATKASTALESSSSLRSRKVNGDGVELRPGLAATRLELCESSRRIEL